MKKLLISAIILTLFAISLTLVQISCSKSGAEPGKNNAITANQLNKVVFSKDLASGGCELWTVNYDGSNLSRIPVKMPADFYIENNNNANAVRLSPDGQTVFFVGNFTNITPGTRSSIYACNIDGSNFRLVVQGESQLMRLGGAY